MFGYVLFYCLLWSGTLSNIWYYIVNTYCQSNMNQITVSNKLFYHVIWHVEMWCFIMYMMYYGVQQEKVIIWNQTWTTQRHQIRSPKVPHQYGAWISQIWAAIPLYPYIWSEAFYGHWELDLDNKLSLLDKINLAFESHAGFLRMLSWYKFILWVLLICCQIESGSSCTVFEPVAWRCLVNSIIKVSLYANDFYAIRPTLEIINKNNNFLLLSLDI